MRRTVLWAVVLLNGTATMTWAQADLALVQGVQASYCDALNAQDAQAAIALFHIRSPGERATAEVFVTNDLAAARLAAACAKVFATPVQGGGTLLPPAETDAWVFEGDLALLHNAPHEFAPLRRIGGRYGIDLIAWGLNWMDGPGAEKTRQRLAGGARMYDGIREWVSDGIFRDLSEVAETQAFDDDGFLAVVADKGVASTTTPAPPPRAFRRPVEIDLSTPQLAHRSLLLAQAEGDGDAWLRCHSMVDPADEATFRAYARLITSSADLEEAAVARFGAAGGGISRTVALPHPRLQALNELTGGRPVPPVAENDAEVAWTEDISGENREMERIDGQWKRRSRPKADIGQPKDDPNDWPAILNTAADVEQRIAGEIGKGRYATAEQARRAIELSP